MRGEITVLMDSYKHQGVRAEESQFICISVVPNQHQYIQHPLLHFLQIPSKVSSASELRFPS